MIKVENLSFAYPASSVKVLKELNFEIAEGEIFGFLGPSGAGKSTTQKVLYKILNKYEGNIFYKNKPLTEWGKEYYEQIGVGFELPNHYLKLTGKENLELFGAFYNKNNLMNLNQLFELVGLEESMNQRVEEYSKGMKMRLNYIRSIMHNPDILFFDEPTAGLDPINAHKIKEHILSLQKDGKTIFITTHDMTTADELCDRVSFLVDGEIRLTEDPSTLKQKHGQNKVQVKLANMAISEFPLTDLGNNIDFLNFIKEGEIIKIKTMDATLEEVFISVTGKALKV